MKKILCAALIAAMLLCVFSCARSDDDSLEGRYEFGGISMILPEDFKVTKVAGLQTAVSKDYPNRTDNITFSEGEGKLSDYTENEVKQELSAVLGDLSDFTFENKTGKGFDMIVVSFSANYLGTEMKEKIYNCFFDGKFVSIRFVSVSGQFDEEFEKAAASIKLAK